MSGDVVRSLLSAGEMVRYAAGLVEVAPPEDVEAVRAAVASVRGELRGLMLALALLPLDTPR